MSYPRRGYSRAPLTPPAELVGQSVKWKPKHATTGARGATQYGIVQSYDEEARTLVIRVSQAVSMWQPNPHRDVTIALSQGPFTTF